MDLEALENLDLQFAQDNQQSQDHPVDLCTSKINDKLRIAHSRSLNYLMIMKVYSIKSYYI